MAHTDDEKKIAETHCSNVIKEEYAARIAGTCMDLTTMPRCSKAQWRKFNEIMGKPATTINILALKD